MNNSKRYETMNYRRVGKSGLLLPEISLGLWHNFGTYDNYSNMKKMCHVAFDNGITHFDLANNYGPEPGSAERNFGKILREDFRNYRDEMIISTKAGYDMWPGPYGNFGSRKYLIASLDQSLKRMGIEYVDIFYHHRMDPDTPLEETVGALDQIVRSGKALYIGISNYDGETLTRIKALFDEVHVPFIINQNRYNIFDRTIENNGLKKVSAREGKGIIAFSPLDQGILSGRYMNGIPKDSRVGGRSVFLHENDITEGKLKKLEKLQAFAKRRGQSLSQLALSWVLKDDVVSSVLIGASKPEQILENLKIIDRKPISEAEAEYIELIVNDKED